MPEQTEATTDWERLLCELETRLLAWQAALGGASPYPDELVWPHGLGPCPEQLEGRARRILVAQHDLHERLSARHAALGTLLRRSEAPLQRSSPALFVDQHC